MGCVEIRQIREMDTQIWGEIRKGLWKTGRLRKIILRWNCNIGRGGVAASIRRLIKKMAGSHEHGNFQYSIKCGQTH
jgi:hypothetical protein